MDKETNNYLKLDVIQTKAKENPESNCRAEKG